MGVILEQAVKQQPTPCIQIFFDPANGGTVSIITTMDRRQTEKMLAHIAADYINQVDEPASGIIQVKSILGKGA